MRLQIQQSVLSQLRVRSCSPILTNPAAAAAAAVLTHPKRSKIRTMATKNGTNSSNSDKPSTNEPKTATATATTMPKLIFAPGENPSDAYSPSNDTAQKQNSSTSTSNSHPSRAAQFTIGSLTRADLNPDPFHQFHTWFTHPSLSSSVPETVTLSTASLPSGRVSSRNVYLKELDPRGFVIYSNWGTSGKAADLATNSHVALCFWWKPLERQVRVEGVAERISQAESQVYFDTRARGSRIGAWASQQSSLLRSQSEGDDGREELENQVRQVEKRFEGVDEVPVPPFWGGLRVIPDMIEFWQGRDSRLHDRFRYSRDESVEGGWRIERLSP